MSIHPAGTYQRGFRWGRFSWNYIHWWLLLNCVGKLKIWLKSDKYRALYMKTELRFIVASEIISPPPQKKFFLILSILFILFTVTRGVTVRGIYCCVSTGRMVTRTHQNVTLYAHCLVFVFLSPKHSYKSSSSALVSVNVVTCDCCLT